MERKLDRYFRPMAHLMHEDIDGWSTAPGPAERPQPNLSPAELEIIELRQLLHPVERNGEFMFAVDAAMYDAHEAMETAAQQFVQAYEAFIVELATSIAIPGIFGDADTAVTPTAIELSDIMSALRQTSATTPSGRSALRTWLTSGMPNSASMYLTTYEFVRLEANKQVSLADAQDSLVRIYRGAAEHATNSRDAVLAEAQGRDLLDAARSELANVKTAFVQSIQSLESADRRAKETYPKAQSLGLPTAVPVAEADADAFDEAFVATFHRAAVEARLPDIASVKVELDSLAFPERVLEHSSHGQDVGGGG